MASCVCFCDRGLAPLLPRNIDRRDRRAGENGWQLCALSPSAAERLARCPLRCKTLLLPEGAYRPVWQAQQVVSYGLSGRSSLTLSSMSDRDMLCVQRTLVDRLGRKVEGQEIPLPAGWSVLSPSERLLLAGIWLLWGETPQGDGE